MSDAEKSHSVEGGVLKSTSVSALKKLMSCEAAYYFRYVLHREEKGGPGAELGTQLHAEIEHYLTTGENVLGDIPRTGLHLLPTPGPDLGVEAKFGKATGFVLEVDGVPFKGFIDLVDPRRVATEGLLVLTDHKFKGDPKRYGTTPAQLRDPLDDDGAQMVGYAMAAYNAIKGGKFPGTKWIRLRHIHYKTKPPLEPARDIYIEVPLEDVPALWSRVSLASMKQVAAAPSVEAVKGNLGACWKYGGCPHREVCPHFGNPKKSDQMKRLAQVLLSKPGARGAPQPKESGMGMLFKKTTSTPAAAPAVTAPAAQTPAPQAPAPTAPVAAVNPPDAAPAVRIPSPPPAAPQAPAPTQAQPIRSESAKPKRTRAPKAETPAAPAAAPAQPAPAAPTAGGFTLYMRGMPTKAKAESLMPYVEGLEQLALEGFRNELKVDFGDDIRLVEGKEVGFGRWKTLFAAMAKENPPAPGAYFVYPGDERVDVVVSALQDLAIEVVR